MRYQIVDTLGILLYGYLIHIVHRDISHGTVCLAHHLGMVPVVGRRGDHLVQILRGLCSTYSVDTRGLHIFAIQHQVARHTGGVEHLFLVLMPCGQDTVGLCPFCQSLHEPLGIEGGTCAEELCTGCGRILSYIIPKGGIYAVWRETVYLFESCIEPLGPHTSFCSVHGGFVKECTGDYCAESFGEMSVILLMGILDEEFHRLWIQVIHIGVS